MSVFEFVKVLYSYNAEDETIGLKLIENTVLQFLEDRGDGWSKGVIGTREGWYPTSYVKKLTVDVSDLNFATHLEVSISF